MSLAALLERVHYKEGWRFKFTPALYGSWDQGRLLIELQTPDSTDPSRMIRVSHTLPVPYMVEEMDPKDQRRWLMQQIVAVETHEACEFFELDGTRPFFPHDETGAGHYGIREAK